MKKVHSHRDYVWRFASAANLAILERDDEKLAYQKSALEIAIANVKKNRSSYFTEEAFSRHLCMLEEGLAMFPAAPINTPPRLATAVDRTDGLQPEVLC